MDNLQEINPDVLNKILEEIADYSIELVEDPTLPEYGNPYLMACISKCRNYMNRVQYYLQKCSAHEKILKKEILIIKTDIDLKIKDMLADDDIVRKQASITDRLAVATAKLADEHQRLGEISGELQDLSETIKIIKMKHRELMSTNSDIKTQRQLIKDDKMNNPDGVTSGKRQDGSLPDGMPPVANKKKIDPHELLDDDKRPDDMPVPRDLGHAKQIASFFNGMDNSEAPKNKPPERSEPDITYEDLLS